MADGFKQFWTARAVAQAYDPNYLVLRYFGGFVPWVFKDIALQREIDGNGLPGYRRSAKSDAQETPTYRYFPAPAATSRTVRPRCGSTRWSGGWGGRCSRESWRRTSPGRSSRIRR